jgi:hypothetical protein
MVVKMKQEHYTLQQYRELIGRKQSTKYYNQKTEADGIRFDSQKEARHYSELKILKNQGKIIDFFMQVPFLLQEGYWKGEEWIKPIYYKADFVVIKWDDDPALIDIVREIHEVKGFTKVKTWEIKKKMFEKRYPEYRLIII